MALAYCLVAGAVLLAWPKRWRLPVDAARVRDRVVALAGSGDRRVIPLSAAVAALAGWLSGGVVGGLVAASYTALGSRAWVRMVTRRRAARARVGELSALAALAADLRVGLPPAAVGLATPSAAFGSLGPRVQAVWRLAETTGAPAAELVSRIEADARALDRGRAAAASEAAGAQVTALLLACLPVGGILLGYGIGADPLEVLLHTPIGAGCAVGATLLQAIGLLWAERLAGQ